MVRSVLVIVAAAALLCGCEVNMKRDGEVTADGKAPAETAARDGEIAIDVPGFDMKVQIPDALRSQISGNSDIIYPGSTMNGLNVTATENKGQGGGQVQMRFTSADAPDKVAAWYRDPARAATLAGVSVQQDGAGFRISGAGKDGGDPFDLRLSPGSGGGTQGQLTLRDRS
jgi:hypothetical protein